jgi:hypothetical protein
MTKTQLPYLIQEALEIGEWKQLGIEKGAEVYQRGSEVVRIGTRALRGTSPESYVYEVVDEEEGFRTNHSIVINLLCLRLASGSKMSTWFDSVSTTTE